MNLYEWLYMTVYNIIKRLMGRYVCIPGHADKAMSSLIGLVCINLVMISARLDLLKGVSHKSRMLIFWLVMGVFTTLLLLGVLYSNKNSEKIPPKYAALTAEKRRKGMLIGVLSILALLAVTVLNLRALAK